MEQAPSEQVCGEERAWLECWEAEWATDTANTGRQRVDGGLRDSIRPRTDGRPLKATERVHVHPHQNSKHPPDSKARCSWMRPQPSPRGRGPEQCGKTCPEGTRLRRQKEQLSRPQRTPAASRERLSKHGPFKGGLMPTPGPPQAVPAAGASERETFDTWCHPARPPQSMASLSPASHACAQPEGKGVRGCAGRRPAGMGGTTGDAHASAQTGQPRPSLPASPRLQGWQGPAGQQTAGGGPVAPTGGGAGEAGGGRGSEGCLGPCCSKAGSGEAAEAPCGSSRPTGHLLPAGATFLPEQ